jgi:RecB family endonuclease NucS
MAIFRMTKEAFVPLSETQFSTENVLERKDLQRLLRTHIGLIDPDLMVISEEFSQWVDSSRSIDLLCLDKDANLVVVELKRTQDGGHMELQAIRYAAMISRITFPQMVEAHKYYLARLRLRPTRRVVLWLRSPVHDELW